MAVEVAVSGGSRSRNAAVVVITVAAETDGAEAATTAGVAVS